MAPFNPGISIIFFSILYLIFIALILFLAKWLYGWYMEIKKRNRFMAAQIKLLAAIAEKQGVNLDFIQETIDIANTKNAVNGDFITKP